MAFASMGQLMTAKDVTQSFNEMDSDRDGSVSFIEFQQWMYSQGKPVSKKGKLKKLGGRKQNKWEQSVFTLDSFGLRWYASSQRQEVSARDMTGITMVDVTTDKRKEHSKCGFTVRAQAFTFQSTCSSQR